jgi:two-component system, NtrC family, response regulator HydG
MPLVLPPLRSRHSDIRGLAEHCVRLHAPRGQTVKLKATALARLQQHSWQGNVRELRNVVHRALLVAAKELGLARSSLFKRLKE